MKAPEIVAFLKHLGVYKVDTSGTWVKSSCPLARWRHKGGYDAHPSFGVYASPHKSFFNCFSCAKSGSLEELLAEMTYYTSGDAVADVDLPSAYKVLEGTKEVGYIKQDDWKYSDSLGPKRMIPWPEDWLSSFMRAAYVPIAKDYLLNRRVTLEQIIRFDVRFDTSCMAVTFPVRDEQSRLVGMRGRYLDNTHHPRYKDYLWHDYNNTGLVWFNENKTTTDLPVILVEGVFDLLAVQRHYKNVLSPLGAQFNQDKMRRIEGYPEIWCFFDNDEAGMHSYEKILTFLSRKVPVRRIEYPSNFKMKDPGEAPDMILADMLKHLSRLEPLLTK